MFFGIRVLMSRTYSLTQVHANNRAEQIHVQLAKRKTLLLDFCMVIDSTGEVPDTVRERLLRQYGRGY